MTTVLVGNLCTRVPTRSFSVYCSMFVQFGIRDPNVMLLGFHRVSRQSATSRSTFLTNAKKKIHTTRIPWNPVRCKK